MTVRDGSRTESTTDVSGGDRGSRGENGLRRLAVYLGFMTAIIAFGTIFLTTAIAPWFSWPHNALSDLGDPGTWSLYWIYNYGMILTGILGTGFAVGAARASRNRVHALGCGIMALTLIDLALVGYFHLGRDLHGTVSTIFFVCLTYGTMLYGTGDVLEGDVARGLALIWLGILHVTQWAAWAEQGFASGVAIPEFVGAVVVLIWMLAAADRMTDRSFPWLSPGSRTGDTGEE